MLGRDFAPEDDMPTAQPVALLSYELWRARYNQDPDVVGRVVRVNAQPTRVIGVMAQGFAFPSIEQLWLPMMRDATQEHRGDQSYETAVGVIGIGSLALGVTGAKASAEGSDDFARLRKLYTHSTEG